MQRLLVLISWTGWSIDDWRSFLYKLTPLYWMSKTGWTKEDWIFETKELVKALGVTGLFWIGLCVIFSGFQQMGWTV